MPFPRYSMNASAGLCIAIFWSLRGAEVYSVVSMKTARKPAVLNLGIFTQNCRICSSLTDAIRSDFAAPETTSVEKDCDTTAALVDHLRDHLVLEAKASVELILVIMVHANARVWHQKIFNLPYTPKLTLLLSISSPKLF